MDPFFRIVLTLLCCVVLWFVCFRPVSCVPNVANVSGLSIPDNTFGLL